MDFDVVIVRYRGVDITDQPGGCRHASLLIEDLGATLASRDIAFGDMKRGQGRIYVETGDARAPLAISRVPGVISCSPALSVGPTVEEAAAFAADVAASIAAKKIGPTAAQDYESFRKYAPEEIGRVNRGAVFAAVRRRKPHVDLGGAKWLVHVELGSAGAYVYTDIVPGKTG